MDHRYIIYCRKSQEAEDRQILSLPAQKKELMACAQKNNLQVIDTYAESASAYKLGRPLFNEMLQRIQDGEADGILVWAYNRLARNALDGGMIIHLLDQGLIKEIKTTSQATDGSGNSKFMLQLEFAMSKKSSDDNSESVKRGNKEKLERGELPGLAKPGYLNMTDPFTKQKYIDIDPDRFRLIQRAFKAILEGGDTPMKALQLLNNEWGYRTRRTQRLGGKPLSTSRFYVMLSDPFYHGVIERKEGRYQGNHQPMITEDEFNRIQIILGKPNKPHATDHEFPYKGLVSCGECGGSVTCEEKWQVICTECKHKFHKSTNRDACPKCNLKIIEMSSPTILHYIYYRCTKKVNKDCTQKSIEISKLEDDMANFIDGFEMPQAFSKWAIQYLHELKDSEVQDEVLITRQLARAEKQHDQQLQSLFQKFISPNNMDGQLISEKEYLQQKQLIMDDKNRIKAEYAKRSSEQAKWFIDATETFKLASEAKKQLNNGDIQSKSQMLAKFGSNLKIHDKKLLIDGESAFFILRKGVQKMNLRLQKFEPKKNIDIRELTTVPDLLIPALQATAEEVRTWYVEA